MKFVFDLDGTLIFQGQPLSAGIIEGLERLTAHGHEVIFASARPIRDMLPVLDKRFHRGVLIGGNGSLIAQGGRVVHAESFEPRQLARLLRLIEDHRCRYLIDGDWDYTYTGPGDHPILRNLDPHGLARNLPLTELNPIVKILLLAIEDEAGFRTELAGFDVVVHEHKHENMLDINPPGIHKWSALQKIGVRPRDFVAFGNDANDISMFRFARHGVMIGSHPDLAPYAAESIPLGSGTERMITAKMEELGARYA